MDIPIGRLQANAEVLLWLAGEPLNLPGDGRGVLLDVGHFEEALVDPRSVDPQSSHLLRQFFSLADPIQADVGVQLTAIGRFDGGLQPRRFEAFLQSLFESPEVDVYDAQL